MYVKGKENYRYVCMYVWGNIHTQKIIGMYVCLGNIHT